MLPLFCSLCSKWIGSTQTIVTLVCEGGKAWLNLLSLTGFIIFDKSEEDTVPKATSLLNQVY